MVEDNRWKGGKSDLKHVERPLVHDPDRVIGGEEPVYGRGWNDRKGGVSVGLRGSGVAWHKPSRTSVWGEIPASEGDELGNACLRRVEAAPAWMVPSLFGVA